MFDIGSILKRSWNILWNYKALWVFALLLVLSGGAGSSGSSGGSGSSVNVPAAGNPIFGQNELNQNYGQFNEFGRELEFWAQENVYPFFATEEVAIRSAIALAAIFTGIMLLITLLLAFVRYPSEAAVIRMVDTHEQMGRKPGFKEGWRLGWDVSAWRIFLVDLIINVPAITFFLLVIALFGWMMYSTSQSAPNLSTGLIIAAVVVFLLFVLAFTVLMIFVSLLRQHVVRYAAIDGMGVGEAFKRGWALFRGQFKNTFIMGLVLFGVGVAVGFVFIFAAILLIPVYILLAVPGVIIAAVPGLLTYLIASLFTVSPVALIIALIIALPVLFVIVFLPLSFLSGMLTVFNSTAWTLTFRQLKPAAPPLVIDVPPPLQRGL